MAPSLHSDVPVQSPVALFLAVIVIVQLTPVGDCSTSTAWSPGYAPLGRVLGDADRTSEREARAEAELELVVSPLGFADRLADGEKVGWFTVSVDNAEEEAEVVAEEEGVEVREAEAVEDEEGEAVEVMEAEADLVEEAEAVGDAEAEAVVEGVPVVQLLPLAIEEAEAVVEAEEEAVEDGEGVEEMEPDAVRDERGDADSLAVTDAELELNVETEEEAEAEGDLPMQAVAEAVQAPVGAPVRDAAALPVWAGAAEAAGAPLAVLAGEGEAKADAVQEGGAAEPGGQVEGAQGQRAQVALVVAPVAADQVPAGQGVGLVEERGQ